MHQSQETFFPTDKPRSWVIAVSSGLIGLLFGSLTFVGYFIGSHFLFNASRFLFAICGLVVLLMMLIFLVNSASGKYREMRSSKWRDRPW